MIDGQRHSQEFVYRGDFEQLWRDVYKDWKITHDILQQDINDNRLNIKLAKQHYINEIGIIEIARKYA